ncbi:MFS transporter [Candidatus Pelagibacter sp. HIMB1493]|jgi:MFS family permease|uniref:MFS transporter n=1 Tax=Candidatus Pelagibacter sp. HIMB1493 TaxID=3413334 RepID=UPI003F876F07|tara:strand:+ start:45 stop:1220 length:1176 start_codon:yes stop_codon:yes gene_type:complete
MNRNLSLLISSQVFGFTAANVTVFLSGIIGSQLSTIKSLATFPPSIYVVGIAISTIFAAKVMSIIGRRLGFVLASIGSSLACLLAAYSIFINSFIIFSFSCFLLGTGMAFIHQYRFAAAETVEKDKAPKAVSMLLLAGIVSAFIGITLANKTKDLISDHVYVGSYIALACLTIMPAIFLSFYKNSKITNKNNSTYSNVRTYKEFVSDPKFLQAMVAATFGYVVMAFLMTATPISMHYVHKLSVDKVGLVIQFHVLGMFLPSLFTGNLIKRFGFSNIMYMGVFFYALTISLSLFEPTFINYFASLIFLGIGWNFLYISGTSLLVTTYNEQEKFKAQGFNDLIVFSATAIGSLSAGILISLLSWKIVNFMCIPFLIIILFVILRADIKKAPAN